ncbi:UvrB/UvrC motif-containing protein [Patescibacteria group bacterium]|nr:UvrB/UvrC motif-containing protein [Patescibacteria group bacterium]
MENENVILLDCLEYDRIPYNSENAYIPMAILSNTDEDPMRYLSFFISEETFEDMQTDLKKMIGHDFIRMMESLIALHGEPIICLIGNSDDEDDEPINANLLFGTTDHTSHIHPLTIDQAMLCNMWYNTDLGVSRDYFDTRSIVGNDNIKDMNPRQLNYELTEALGDENYERAAKLRDQLTKIKTYHET